MANKSNFLLRKSWLSNLLVPFSWLYATLFKLNRLTYQLGWRHNFIVKVPVIVVGNLLAGGAGKTPTVLALAKFLTQQNIQVGIISRGYKAKQSQKNHAIEVLSHHLASEIGDEPLLLKQQLKLPTFICANRYLAATSLLAKYPQTQVILADDGLQHFALQRDIEICVFDERVIGNGRLLPAGLLREPFPHLSPANCRQLNLVVDKTKFSLPMSNCFTARRNLANYAINGLGEQRLLSSFSQQPCQAISAIANPTAFFAMLQHQLQLHSKFSRPDHYNFTTADIVELKQQSWPIFCTEKDAVKLWHFEPNIWAVPLEVNIDGQFFHSLSAILKSNAKFSNIQ